MTETLKTNGKEAGEVTVKSTEKIRNSGKNATNSTRSKAMMIQGNHDISGKTIDAIIETEVQGIDAVMTHGADSTPIKVDTAGIQDETKKKIIEMLTENTGIGLLDSGDAHGRAWQQNRTIEDFDKIAKIKATVNSKGSFEEITRSTYHFLMDQLSINAKSKAYQTALEHLINSSDESYIDGIREFISTFKESRNIVNTYSDTCLLDHGLQVAGFYDGEEDFVILQIHTGCDERVGYTAPYIFAGCVEDLICGAGVECHCTKCGGQWDSDDGGFEWSGDSNLEVKSKDGKVYHKRCGGVLVFQ